MNILRQPPFPLSVSYTGLTPYEPYVMQVYDDHSTLVQSFDIEADSDGEVIQELPSNFTKYDDIYSLYIYSLDVNDDPDEVVLIDTLYIYRPYLNPMTVAETDGEIEQYTAYERTARQIIDVITGGFYYQSGKEQVSGNGTDYLPISKRINRLNYVYQNNVLVYDRFDTEAVQNTYYITPDYSAISIAAGTEYNRMEYKKPQMPIGASDSFALQGDNYDAIDSLTEYRGAALFPKDYDYIVYADFGWPVVPQDIQEATRMLVDDIKCNKLTYVNRYVSDYQTDQFRIRYSDLASQGTGNMMVDRILSSYTAQNFKIGVL